MKWKRRLAMAGVVCIFALYAVALAAALSHSPNSASWLMAAIFCTVAVPVMIYAIELAYRLMRRDDRP